ncbi:MAG: ribosome maturation factor RimM [Deltaproteobacteria bacterium]|jgi:16S rRNA processing protein RimM|nr:ribosome maturation factor RimM [Deltaproteobacteria bacterium]
MPLKNSASFGPSGLIRLARIAAPHGIQGAVKLLFFGGDPFVLETAKELYLEGPEGNPKSIKVKSVTASKKAVIVQLEDIQDRNAASLLKGHYLSLPRAALPQAQDDEYYQADLLGFTVAHEKTTLGQVIGFQDYGPYTLLAFCDTTGKEILVPWTSEFILDVDSLQKTITIDAIEGLLDQG